ncbi:MAG: YbaN family protein [Tateyamaria sp.]|uniref:YbaN family protein n=1 Tax=Tateyamaria sp. TaxID=1929288 RepID=UPI00328A0E08
MSAAFPSLFISLGLQLLRFPLSGILNTNSSEDSVAFAKPHMKDPSCARSKLALMLWLLIGIIALGCGAIGVLLPILPTTPLVILAAFAFAKGSPQLRRWLVEHRIFGPMIADWEGYGAIARQDKIFACCIMAASLFCSFLVGVRPSVLIVQALILCAAATYVLTRPTADRTPQKQA